MVMDGMYYGEENSEEKRLGKINNIYFGIQENRLGLHIEFKGEGWGCNWSESFFDPTLVEIGEFTKWTQNDRDSKFLETIDKISKTLNNAKVKLVSELKNIPVECTFKDYTLKDWRILTEVL